MTEITQALEDAYRATRYEVYLEDGIVADIRIGTRCTQLDDLCDKYPAMSWALITACNPLSQIVPDKDNQRRQGLLEALLIAEKFEYFTGRGIDESDDWPPEPSFLILGIDKEKSLAYGRMFDQNAIVYGDRGDCAQLLFCVQR